MEFLGQQSDSSHTCDPCHSCGSAGSLTHCAGPGLELAFQCSRDTTNPAALGTPRVKILFKMMKRQHEKENSTEMALCVCVCVCVRALFRAELALYMKVPKLGV